MKGSRLIKLQEAAKKRQTNLAVILENVHDLHNLGAVMRTADSVGAQEIYVLFSDPNQTPKKVKLGKRTSAGTRRWLDVYFYTDTQRCFEDVRKKYSKIYATHLASNSVSLYDLDLSDSVALLFGNEAEGISTPALDLCDGNFIIPQVGMAQSLNISVAAAITLYEAYRQRKSKGMYDENSPQSPEQQQLMQEYFLERSKGGDRDFVAKEMIN